MYFKNEKKKPKQKKIVLKLMKFFLENNTICVISSNFNF